MAQLKIDPDALFRAITATDYKLLSYSLNLESGEIVSRTLHPDEVAAVAQGSIVPALPKMGGDLTPKKDASPFGALLLEQSETQKAKNLFKDDTPKKTNFETDFWKRDEKTKPSIFGEGGFQRENATKKLAEIFGDAPAKKKSDPFARPATPMSAPPTPMPVAPQPQLVPLKPSEAPPVQGSLTRIPAADQPLQLQWMTDFARTCGAPEIRDELLAGLKTKQPSAGFERVLRKHQRMGQQWERQYRKRALESAEAWLSTLGLQWEFIEKNTRP